MSIKHIVKKKYVNEWNGMVRFSKNSIISEMSNEETILTPLTFINSNLEYWAKNTMINCQNWKPTFNPWKKRKKRRKNL